MFNAVSNEKKTEWETYTDMQFISSHVSIVNNF